MIKIGGRKIGWGYPPIISAELSLNHQADLNLAIKMIDEVAEAGADAVKLQYFKVEDFCTDKEKMVTYEQWLQDLLSGNARKYGCRIVDGKLKSTLSEEVTETEYELFKRHEISLDFVKACQQRAKKKHLIFGVTPTSVKGVKELGALGIDFFKIASDMIGKKEMLTEMGAYGIPKIISTGHLTLDEVRSYIINGKRWSWLWLHCVSEYPTINPQLWKIRHLQEFDCHVGYSDHTLGIESAIRAIELGATWVEKHFTSDKTLPGPDHWYSADKEELTRLAKAVK